MRQYNGWLCQIPWVLDISLCENLSTLQSLFIFIVYCPCVIVIPKSANRIRVFRCAWTSKCYSNLLLLVYFRRTGRWNMTEFGIFTKSTMLNNSQSIAQNNSYQLFDSPVTDPAQNISIHPGIERLSQRYRVDVSWPKTSLMYFRIISGIQLTIPSLRNEVQAHPRSTCLSSLTASGLTPHAYFIESPISISPTHHLHVIPLQVHLWTVYTHFTLP